MQTTNSSNFAPSKDKKRGKSARKLLTTKNTEKMKADKQTSAQAQANVQNAQVENAQAKAAKVAQAACAYIERMQVNKYACTSSPKIAYKAIRDYSTIPSDLFTLAVESAAYASYLAYMKNRHGIPAEDKTSAPAHGWSVWYALQWAEQQVKAAAADEAHPAHAKAVAYLRKTRAQLQAQAEKTRIF